MPSQVEASSRGLWKSRTRARPRPEPADEERQRHHDNGQPQQEHEDPPQYSTNVLAFGLPEGNRLNMSLRATPRGG